MRKDITLGNEYDEKVLAALKHVLTLERAKEIASELGVGGSQEIHAWT